MKINIWKYTINIYKRPSRTIQRDPHPVSSLPDVIELPPPASHQSSLVPVSSVYTKKHNKFTEAIGIIAEEAFQVFLVTYLFLLLVETIKTDFVSYFFNLNILLGIVMVTGILMTLFAPEKQTLAVPSTIHWKYIATISIAAALLVYYKTEDLRGLSVLLTILTGGIIFLLSYVISIDSKEVT